MRWKETEQEIKGRQPTTDTNETQEVCLPAQIVVCVCERNKDLFLRKRSRRMNGDVLLSKTTTS